MDMRITPDFFLTKIAGLEYAEWLGQMSPLANKSFTCRITSCFSLGDSLYLGLNTGDESATPLLRDCLH